MAARVSKTHDDDDDGIIWLSLIGYELMKWCSILLYYMMMRHHIGLHGLVWRKWHDIPWHDSAQWYWIKLQVYTTAAIAAEKVKIGDIQLGEQLGKEVGKGRGATMKGGDQSIVISGDTTHTVLHCTTPHTSQHNTTHHTTPYRLLWSLLVSSHHSIFLPLFSSHYSIFFLLFSSL